MDLRVIYFPDINFKNYLLRHFDKDGDGEISLTEALSITKILCPQLGIKSLAGIEYFPNLTILDCSRNELESLDVSHNIKLEHLSCFRNFNLSYLDVSFNPLLKSLYCGNCNLNLLDVHQNKNLSILSCGFNPIEQVELEENTQLSLLRVRRCDLIELSLTGLKKLRFLDCSENKIYELQLSDCTELEHLNCNSNDLHNDLYLGENIKLSYLDCRRNPNLYSITVSNGQNIKNILSTIKPTTVSSRQYAEYKEYIENKSYDSMENLEYLLLDAFEGDDSNYWNIE